MVCFGIIIVLLASSVLVVLPSDAKAAGTTYPIYKTEWGFFKTELIKSTSGSLIGGNDIGDANNDGRPELVAGGGGKEFHIIGYNANKGDWTDQTITPDGDNILGVCIDEVNSTNPGNELLIGGFSGNLWEYHFKNATYNMTKVHAFASELWVVKVGDLMPEKPGNEIAVAHSTENISVLYKNNGTWESMDLKVAAATRALDIGEFDPAHSGLELATGSEQGDLEEFYWTGSLFKHELMNKADRAIRNVAIGDYCSLNPGNEIIEITYSFGAGNATMIYPSAGSWKTLSLYNSTRGLEALGLGDLNPLHPGIEAVFAGYSNRVTMVVDDAKTATAVDIFEAEASTTNELVAVAVGDIDPLHKGSEVFLMEKNGDVNMISYEWPGVKLSIGVTEGYELDIGEDLELQASAVSQGGYDGDVEITTKLQVRDPLSGYVDAGDDTGITLSYIRTAPIADEAPASLSLKVKSTDLALAGDYRLLMTIASPLDAAINDSGAIQFTAVRKDIRSVRMVSFTAVPEGKGYSVTAVVENTGNIELDTIGLVFYLNDHVATERTVTSISPDDTEPVTFHLDVPEGNNTLRVELRDLPAGTLVSNPDNVRYLEGKKESKGDGNSAIIAVVVIMILVVIIALTIGVFLYMRSRTAEEEGPDPRGRKRGGGRSGRNDPPASRRGTAARPGPKVGRDRGQAGGGQRGGGHASGGRSGRGHEGGRQRGWR